MMGVIVFMKKRGVLDQGVLWGWMDGCEVVEGV